MRGWEIHFREKKEANPCVCCKQWEQDSSLQPWEREEVALRPESRQKVEGEHQEFRAPIRMSILWQAAVHLGSWVHMLTPGEVSDSR